ncbi:unnamed protein product [Ilex paraguariensis]|uniref:Phytocyanin domain-containing protein n=1 Tax=Ilex paraguariensis TaxID=185542 RepID=A0ABC8T8I3_9AQUA
MGNIALWLMVVVGQQTCAGRYVSTLHLAGGTSRDFGFDDQYHDILEVNKTSYEKCREKNFLKNITKRSSAIFTLLEAKTYYYLSDNGHCVHGMKLAADVQDLPSPPGPQVSSRRVITEKSSKKEGWIAFSTMIVIFIMFFT